MSREWSNKVLFNFDNAALKYSQKATLQRALANRLAGHCKRTSIPNGLWVDLGCGTGLLADAIESFYANKRVLRVDGSYEMLKMNKEGSTCQIYNLSNGLPLWNSRPTLICSNFCLHWFKSPADILENWFTNLALDGLLALVVPINGSFHQWHIASEVAGAPCTAIPLPDASELCKTIPSRYIQFKQILNFTRFSDHPVRLIKAITNVGAGASNCQKLSPNTWRKIFTSWPKESNANRNSLTWKILLLLIRR